MRALSQKMPTRPAAVGSGSRAAARATTPGTAPRSRARAVVVRANQEGVKDLLARDRRRNQVELVPELQPAKPEPAPAAEQQQEGRGRGRGGRFKSRSQRQRDMAANEGAASSSG